MSGWFYDFGDALRQIRRRPFHSLIIAAVLTIGLSATAAALSYIHAFKQPFPGVDSQGLVRLFELTEDDAYADMSFLDYLDYTAGTSVQDLAVAQPYYAASVRLETQTEVAFIESVTGNLFPMAGVAVVEGRGLEPADDQLSADPVAVISHEWWQTLFGSDTGVLGTTVYLNYRPFTVVGVASPSFRGTASDNRPDVWIPIAHFRDRYVSWDRSANDRDTPLARVYGRLARGVSLAQAEAEMAGIAGGLDEAYPRETGPRKVRVEAATWIDPRAREAESPTLRVMVIASGGLLLLVCANVANLLMAVSVGRRREMVARAALGASPLRLLRQGMMENVCLAMIAGLASFLLAGPLSARLGSYFARPSVWAENVSREAPVDEYILWVTLGVALLVGLVAGAVPAFRAIKVDLVSTLKSEAGDASGRVRKLWGLRLPGGHDLLITAQIALTVILLVVAGLVVRTLSSAESVDPGFAYQGVISSHISTSSTDLEPEERGRFFEEISARLAEEPWVRSVAVKDQALLSGQPSADFRLDVQGEPVSMIISRVLPGFFHALGVELVEGRPLSAGDTASAPGVAIINQAAAERFFGAGAAVGRRIWWPAQEGMEAREFEVVGVSTDIRARDVLIPPEPMVFFSLQQHTVSTGNALHIVTAGDPKLLVPRTQQWLRRYEPHLAIINVLPYSEVVAGSLYAQRMNAELFSVLASLAVALAAFGIFSVLTLSVGRRTREIGVRIAIGARGGDIGWLMMGRALYPVGLGLALGLFGAFMARPVVGGLLYGVQPTDPVTMVSGVVVLLLMVLVATYLPVRRAASIDPVEALRLGD